MERLNKLAAWVSLDTAQKLGYAGCYFIELIKLRKNLKSLTNNIKVRFHVTKLLSYKFEPLASSILHPRVSLIDIFNNWEIKR